MNKFGPIATQKFEQSLYGCEKINKWNDFQNIWAGGISYEYGRLRSEVMKLGSNPKYGKQENQTLDVKMDVLSGMPSPSSDIIN